MIHSNTWNQINSTQLAPSLSTVNSHLLNSGSLIGSPVPGLMEYDGNLYYFTDQKSNRYSFSPVLTAALTIYVRTDGSDSNTGLVDSAGGAFLTVQKAVNTAVLFDNGGNLITIQIRDGTYTGAVTLKSFNGSARIQIQGNNGTPANVVISTTSVTGFTATSVQGLWDIRDLKITTTSSGSCILADNSTVYFRNLNFGSVPTNSNQVLSQGKGLIVAEAAYTISGGAFAHFSAIDFGMIQAIGITITVSGTPAFAGIFAGSSRFSYLKVFSLTFSGSATGTRYLASENSVIFTNGGGATYFPGNANGSTATGGQYV